MRAPHTAAAAAAAVHGERLMVIVKLGRQPFNDRSTVATCGKDARNGRTDGRTNGRAGGPPLVKTRGWTRHHVCVNYNGSRRNTVSYVGGLQQRVSNSVDGAGNLDQPTRRGAVTDEWPSGSVARRARCLGSGTRWRSWEVVQLVKYRFDVRLKSDLYAIVRPDVGRMAASLAAAAIDRSWSVYRRWVDTGPIPLTVLIRTEPCPAVAMPGRDEWMNCPTVDACQWTPYSKWAKWSHHLLGCDTFRRLIFMLVRWAV